MDGSARNPAFPRMISDFCRQRGAGALPPRATEQLRLYMLDLLRRGEPPPAKGRGLAWREIARTSGVDEELLLSARHAFRPGFEALRRELRKAPRRAGARRKPVQSKPPAEARREKKLRTEPARREPVGRRRGPKPTPIVEIPTASPEPWRDPPTFHAALALHMHRHGDTPAALCAALLLKGFRLDRSTIRMWRGGLKAPNHCESMAFLAAIEVRYGLPDGYFKAKLPHLGRATRGRTINGISDAERRRLAWHLPDDFDLRSAEEREEILTWVREVVVSGATDYRRFQRAATRHRYAIRFPGLQGVRPLRATPEGQERLEGVVHAPPQLADEMAALVAYKTATLTPLGYQRRGAWGEETASQRIEHLGLMFGALAAARGGAVRGRGLPLSALTFGLLVLPQVWDWYLTWREQRRGFYTAWEIDMLTVAAAFTAPETGWLTQNPALGGRLQPIDGLVTMEEAEAIRGDWRAACARLHKHALHRSKEIGRVARVHRDPFEPILAVLEAPSPLGEYRKIADEVLRLMPCPRRYPKAAAEAVRSFLLIRLGLHLGFRQKNLRQLLVKARGELPSSERFLTDQKRGELRWSERDAGWEVFVPAAAFKNAGSSFFSGRPFRLVLPDLATLYEHIEAWVDRHRRVVLGPAKDPGTFFIKSVKRSSSCAEYEQTTFYEAWRWTIQRYGIFNPWTGRGAIPGLLPHGPHNVRDVLATHVLKLTGSYEQASYAIQDTPEVVAQHYGRFLPRDKAALAAQVLNKVWETD